MSVGQLKVQSENILPIIKRWLYSEKNIFLRELVSNACDAIHKLKILRDQGQTDAKDEEFSIKISINNENKTLTISDTGLGMTANEVEKYIAELAFSGAEDFVEKYKSKDTSDQIIGHFGLGFYSSYMVANKVEIQTLSYQNEAIPALWTCDGSSEYTLEEGTRKERGTDIVLHIPEEEKEFLEEDNVKKILKQFCSFLPYPIYLGEEKLNTQEPLWIRSPSECTEEDYHQFFNHLYPFEEKPLFWIHLNVDYPFNLKGILFFTKLDRDYAHKQETIHLYCNRVFVADHCKDILPEYLTPLRGVIDSPDIPLNVSRSHLQVDRTVKQVASHISKKVADRLKSFFTADRTKFEECWPNLEVVIKLGMLKDDKFYDRVNEIVLWKTTKGEWTTLADYLERNQEKAKDKIFYTNEGTTSHFLKLYEDQGIEVLTANPYIDVHLTQFLENKMTGIQFQRVDSEVDPSLIDKDREQNILDSEGRTEASKLAETAKKLLNQENLEVRAESLADDSIPALVTLDEQGRRMRDYFKSSNPEMAQENLLGKNTLILNTNNPMIQKIKEMETTDAPLAADLLKEVYELSLLSQQELRKEDLTQFVTRTNTLLQKLLSK